MWNVVGSVDHEDGASVCSEAEVDWTTLSVFMPVYNECWTLPETVDRVLSSPLPLQVELIIVDDASTDDSWQVIRRLAERDRRIKAVRHARHGGKGAAVRTAMEHMTGEVAVVQEANLEYDPHELPRLLRPIIEGRADAVFGSRLGGDSRRVLWFWHGLLSRGLTLLSNMLNDLDLADMETCYKMVRADVLKWLRLRCDGSAMEAELTCRLEQWGARIYEVPIHHYNPHGECGRKTRAVDALKAAWETLRCKFLDPQFTDHSGHYVLASLARAASYHRWTLKQVNGFLGQRLMEAGCGIGNLSKLLLDRERLVLVDCEPTYVSMLRRRFEQRRNVRIDCADLTAPAAFARWKGELLDTVFCSNVLEHLERDEEVLRGFEETLVPGGHCIIVAPAGRWLYTGMDRELGHCRRYTREELAKKMTDAGFEVVFARQFSKLGALGWAISGHLFRRRHVTPRQMIWFDRLLPLAKLLDYLLPVPGMSLIMVGRKPRRMAVRLAA